ncbi:MAG: redoxin domain-containing protein [Bacteroidota bacterium]
MKAIKILVLLSLLALGCQAKQQESTFTFTIGSDQITSISISKFNYEQDKMLEWKQVGIDSKGETVSIKDLFSEPAIYRIKLNTGKEMKIAVEHSGGINFQLNDEIILHSPIASELNFGKKIENLNQQFFADMILDFDQAIKNNDKQQIAELEKKKDVVLTEFIAALEGLVREMGASAKAFDALSYLDLFKNNNFFKEMLNEFEEKYPASGMTKSIADKVGRADQLAVGSKIQDFKGLDQHGVEISLSDYRGTYILIDFWASWCRPCRIENPRFTELYKDRGEVNFEIVGISIDSDKVPWQKAMEKDGVEWPQILDSEMKIYKQYLLSSLPANFLLDKEGIIIAKNINAEQLKTKLESIN